MKIGIVGLGLIGGSLAKAVKLHTKHEVLGYDISGDEMGRAELTNAIDGRLTGENLPECEIVLVALYPHDIVRYISENADRFGAGTLVIDCGGVKKFVTDELAAVKAGRLWHFIGGHPMAGREYSGFRHAQDDLFENAPMILTPGEDISLDLRGAAKEFFLDIGFGRVVFTTPEKHDEMIAYTSQLAHIISNVYIRSELAMKHKGFSANSFQDMTRVARLNARMWSELFLENKDALVAELDGITERIGAVRDAIADGDEARLTALLQNGNDRKELLDS
ncbi:MAG: prephenate dehydrogenase [Clostridiales Family XIII bacterium]|jgi:prephenate dehydrogenase|nr:prephenate dehydrogenase [Clostridiales Family XIII bacterium]